MILAVVVAPMKSEHRIQGMLIFQNQNDLQLRKVVTILVGNFIFEQVEQVQIHVQPL